MDDPIVRRSVSEHEPHDELTKKAAALLELMAEELGDDLKYLVIVTDDANSNAGLGARGYTKTEDIAVDLMLNALAAVEPDARIDILKIFNANRRKQ